MSELIELNRYQEAEALCQRFYDNRNRYASKQKTWIDLKYRYARVLYLNQKYHPSCALILNPIGGLTCHQKQDIVPVQKNTGWVGTGTRAVSIDIRWVGTRISSILDPCGWVGMGIKRLNAVHKN